MDTYFENKQEVVSMKRSGPHNFRFIDIDGKPKTTELPSLSPSKWLSTNDIRRVLKDGRLPDE